MAAVGRGPGIHAYRAGEHGRGAVELLLGFPPRPEFDLVGGRHVRIDEKPLDDRGERGHVARQGVDLRGEAFDTGEDARSSVVGQQLVVGHARRVAG